MKKRAQRAVAEEAARFMVEGLESEYLHAKERASLMLGTNGQRYPSNKRIKEWIGRLTKAELGEEETAKRVREMREIAVEIMHLIDVHDPYLIGSALTGEIRKSSDIDLHAYSDDFEELKSMLHEAGYENVEEDLVENRKGKFVHLKWEERGYPVEITVYEWSKRGDIPISSVTGKPMKRADLPNVTRLLRDR